MLQECELTISNMEATKTIKFKKRKRAKRKYWWFVALVVVLALIWYFQGVYFSKDSSNENTTLFPIEGGEGLQEIASKLKKAELIKSEFLFELFTVGKGLQAHLLAGKYDLSSAMNIPEILAKISSGDTIKQKITIVEGWDLQDIGWYFENQGMFQAEEVLEITGFPGVDYSKTKDLPSPKNAKALSEEFSFLKGKPKNVSLEGYLFPDTYEIGELETLNEILRKFLQNFDKKVSQELKQEAAKQGRTLFEVLTMASLLEKEVKTYEDKQIVAGILWKRLKSWWPLQVDATLTYITGKGSLELTKEDLKTDSPYNTYENYGLPLGPICNPGLDSIKAAVYYKDSPYWFYLTNSIEETIFSKTLEEHGRAKYKYLK